jgi:mannose-1-phosphate guanylyltransferase
MSMSTEMPEDLRTSASEPAHDASTRDWTLALAGGEGVRLADYVQRRFGCRIPKQYCRLVGDRSMLEHTLERLNKLTAPSRTLTVIGSGHAEHALPQLAGKSDHVFRQPGPRDTGVAMYVALAMIKRWQPDAVVTITPTDHYVAPSARYVAQVRTARSVAGQLRDSVVVLGARVRSSDADPELGYLVLGDELSQVPQLRRVTELVEQPGRARAQQLVDAGALACTMVACGTLDALWELGRAAEPQLIDILDSFVPLVGTRDETEAIEWIYNAVLPVSLAHDVFERGAEHLVALELEGIAWSDWGRAEQIESALAAHRSRGLVPGRACAP